MREIKFRAWHKKWNLMATEIELGKAEAGIIVGNSGDVLDIAEEYSNLTFMQYTGLKDKNGKEIYEGDIVELVMPDTPYVIQGNGYSDVEVEKGFRTTGMVRFLYSCWFIDQKEGKGCPLDFDEKQQLEIIGNIYENPELINS